MSDDSRRSPEPGRGPRETGPVHAGMPRWVRVLLLIGVVLLVLMIVMLLTGHGPAQHMHNMSLALRSLAFVGGRAPWLSAAVVVAFWA